MVTDMTELKPDTVEWAGADMAIDAIAIEEVE